MKEKIKDRQFHNWTFGEYKSHQAVNQTLISTHEIDGAPFCKEIWHGEKVDKETTARTNGRGGHFQ